VSRDRPADAAGGGAWGPDVRNVLAVRLDSIGDVIMTTPAVRALRSPPRRRVTMLTSTAGAEAARLVPEIDRVLVYDAPWMKASPPRVDASFDLATIERLRSERFDAAAIFTVYSQNPQPAALLCYLADIPRRLAHSREPAYGLLTDRIADPEPERLVRHEVERQLDLVAAVGCRTSDRSLSLRVGPHAFDRADAVLATSGLVPERPWAVLHPGASAASRRYPADAFAVAASDLAERHGWQIVLSGGPDDRDAVEEVRARMRSTTSVLPEDLDLETLAAVLHRAPLLIANNSGPAHLAAAVGTPVVELYALTNPQHTPWGVESRVLYRDVPCRFCYASVCPEGHHGCLRGVPPSEVVSAALELAGRPHDGPAHAAARSPRPIGA
jgi:lipopolysaccharide heptosyltransferase II